MYQIVLILFKENNIPCHIYMKNNTYISFNKYDFFFQTLKCLFLGHTDV